MPIHQDTTQVNRGKEHIDYLKSNFPNVSDIVTDLTEVFETFKTEISNTGEEHLYNLSLANARARLRMTTLYFHAGINGLLVAGTGNKIEDFGVGFYTKYGDGGVDFANGFVDQIAGLIHIQRQCRERQRQSNRAKRKASRKATT